VPLGFGIDLGTTNSAVAVYNSANGDITSLSIKQPVSSGLEQDFFTLPSFLYLPPPKSGEKAAGALAREKLGEQQGRVITSAKSWLAEPSVDPTRKFLPWASDVVDSSELISPVEASAFYLSNLKSSIEDRFGKEILNFSNVVITVPASFDERASELTLQAARLAGFPEGTELIEEPQAAFYRYISTSKIPSGVQSLLVCDIGGGTTDLSLFKVEWIQGRSTPELERVRVGNHLLLGGDNLDLGVAQLIKKEIEVKGKSLSRTQWQKLLSLSQGIKEQALNPNMAGEIVVSLPDAGRSLFKSTLTHKVSLEAIKEYLLREFFPSDAESDVNEALNYTPGALNYARDQRFSVQVEKFLKSSLHDEMLDAVLFVGGTLVPAIFREQILERIKQYQGYLPLELEQSEMELAVSLGAAEFIKRKVQKEDRIRSGQARSLYLELGGKSSELLCLLPLGFEAGKKLLVSPENGALAVRVNTPVRFNLYSSTTRDEDRSGQTVGLDEQIVPVAPLNSMLNLTGSESRISELPVQVSVYVNELGRLELSLFNDERQRQWKLSFGLAAQSEPDAQLEIAGRSSKQILKPAAKLIEAVFGTGGTSSSPQMAKGLFKALETALDLPRKEWDPLLLRGLWSLLERGMTKKNRSKDHELTWISLAGYTLRPGIGVELDQERSERLWKIFNLGLSFPKEKAHLVQWWTMWRRVSLGLDSKKQNQLFKLALPKGINSIETKSLISDPERLRLVSSLELLESSIKSELFNRLWESYAQSPSELVAWCLSRLIARNLLSEKTDTLISSVQAEEFVREALLLDLRLEKFSTLTNAIIRAAELSKDRILEIDPAIRELVIQKCKQLRLSPDLYQSLLEYKPLGTLSYKLALGEELPPGLILRKGSELDITSELSDDTKLSERLPGSEFVEISRELNESPN